MTVDCWYGLAGIASCACNVQKILGVFILFKDGADLRMESFSCKQSLHTFSPGANGFTLFYVEVYVFIFFLISKRDR